MIDSEGAKRPFASKILVSRVADCGSGIGQSSGDVDAHEFNLREHEFNPHKLRMHALESTPDWLTSPSDEAASHHRAPGNASQKKRRLQKWKQAHLVKFHVHEYTALANFSTGQRVSCCCRHYTYMMK